MENSESLRVGLDSSDAEVAFSPICSSAPVTISDSDGMTGVVTTKITTVSEVLFCMASDLVLVKWLLQRKSSFSFR